MKKIAVLNGSPRAGGSMTMRLVNAFLEGAAQVQEADVKVLDLARLSISHCRGCFGCWKKTPGRCVQRDDMDSALELYANADTVIWATPVYHFGMTAVMKKFVERTLPLLYPYQVRHGGLYMHPRRRSFPQGRQNLVFATCGFPDDDNFRAMKEHFQKLLGEGLSCCFFLTEGELLGQSELRTFSSPVLEHLRQAGSEWQRTGTIREEHLQALRRPMVPAAQFAEVANMTWSAPGETPPTPEQTRGEAPYDPRENHAAAHPAVDSQPAAARSDGASPRPDEAAAFVNRMAAGLNPDRAKGLKAVLELAFSDLEEAYQLRIDQGRCTVLRGTPERPTTRIRTSFETWKSISEGRISGPSALFEGLYRVEGDFGLMMRMSEGLFSGAADSRKEGALSDARPTEKKKRNLLLVALVPWYLGWYLNTFSALWWIVLPLVAGASFLIARVARREATWFEWATPACFAVLGGLFLAAPGFTAAHVGALCNLMIGALWGASLLAGRPLTQEYSRNNYSEAITASALFRRVNGILTAFWAILFLVESAAGFALRAVPPGRLSIIMGLTMVPALVFTAVFPRLYVARRARRGGP